MKKMLGKGYPQLKADNFGNWLFRVEYLLDEKQLKKNIINTHAGLSGDEFQTFLQNDAKAKSIIVQCVTDKHLNIVKDAKTAKEMINTLKNLVQRKSVVSKLHLKRKLLMLKCRDTETLEEYFLKFDNLVRELEYVTYW